MSAWDEVQVGDLIRLESNKIVGLALEGVVTMIGSAGVSVAGGSGFFSKPSFSIKVIKKRKLILPTEENTLIRAQVDDYGIACIVSLWLCGGRWCRLIGGPIDADKITSFRIIAKPVTA